MKLEKNVENWGSAIGWMVGAALFGFGVYQLLRSKTASKEVDLEPAASPPEPHPYFDPHPHRHQEPVIPKSQVSDHRTHAGNRPGERNQIGGRASGITARY